MMTNTTSSRRRFLRECGAGAAVLPFLSGLPSAVASESASVKPKKRLIVIFSPNGTLPKEFWPDQFGADHPLALKPIMSAFEPFADKTLVLKGVNNKIRGDGDNHMRGMSCLLTADKLHPGNIQGGSHTPAGWASSISIDQEISRFFQSDPESRTRFGSLEFGVAVPHRADPWTRMCYTGSNQPLAPIDDPGQMFDRIYGNKLGRQRLAGVADIVRSQLGDVAKSLSQEDRLLLDEHLQQVRDFEQEIESAKNQEELVHPEPDIDPEIELTNDNTPQISRMQIDLLISALANDMTRVASLQFMRSVGQARMRWLDIEEGHHSLSHEPDDNEVAYDKLLRINKWFAGEIAYLVKRLSEIPERGDQQGTLLDNTQIVWINELGKGNSHTLDNIPFVLIGGGAGFQTGLALDLDGVPHNRLWLALAHGLGHESLRTFGKEDLCTDGPLKLS